MVFYALFTAIINKSYSLFVLLFFHRYDLFSLFISALENLNSLLRARSATCKYRKV